MIIRKTVAALAVLSITCVAFADDAKQPTTAPTTFDGEPNTLSDKEKTAGWKLLFDGKTTANWNNWKTKKALETGKWVADNGMLTLTGKGGGDIYTADAFEHYELVLEWKTKGNSGILIRVNPEAGGPIYKVAPEMQIEKSEGKKSTSAGGLYALYDIDCEGEKIIHKDGWNHVRIRMVGGHGTHWFNGKRVADYQIGSDDWNKRVAASKFKKWKGFGETAKGHIGFQDHGAQVSFRNVKIRSLDAEGKPAK